jgi:putative nucleotidyltransferase with HDIG domain
MLTLAKAAIPKTYRLSTHHNVAAHLISLHSQSNFNLANILKLISSDPVLTAQILFIANNHFLNSEQQVISVEQAMVVLGTTMVRELVMSLCILSIFEQNNQNIYNQAFWIHSLYTAVTMKVLADNFDSVNANLLYTAGLLHDIGKVYLLNLHGKEYEMILQTGAEKDSKLIEVEKKVLGVNHCEIGVLLLKHWKLPENIIKIVKYHHHPEDFKSGKKLGFWIRLVYFGNLVAQALEKGLSNYADLIRLDSRFKDYLSISEKDFHRLLESTKKELQAKQHIIKILGN